MDENIREEDYICPLTGCLCLGSQSFGIGCTCVEFADYVRSLENDFV